MMPTDAPSDSFHSVLESAVTGPDLYRTELDVGMKGKQMLHRRVRKCPFFRLYYIFII